MPDKLADFVLRELEERSWSMRELARRAELSSTAISDVVNGKERPGSKWCRSVARALHVPPEEVFRLAGILPPVPAEVAEEQELLHLFRKLPADKRQTAIVIVRALLQEVSR